MPATCPVCQAVNAAGPACRRCKADLTLVWAVLAQRQAWLERAAAAAERGDYTLAVRAARAAAGLVGDERSRQSLAALLACEGQFAAALAAAPAEAGA